MIETNTNTAEFSLVAKGREFLQRGEVSAAVECYGKAFDPEAIDETEARSMLIEARSHLSRKHLLEALECFEEALLMGTEIQRRQALEGITTIGEMKTRLVSLTAKLKSGLNEIVGNATLPSIGLGLVSEEENTVLITNEAVRDLSGRMAVGKKLTRLPQRYEDYQLPVDANRCITYGDEDDVRFILDVAKELVSIHRPGEEI
jgi:tetratricopeptide (TPR) repeat protein